MTVEMLVYRTDLLAEAGVAAPITANDALAVARRLHNPGQGLYGSGLERSARHASRAFLHHDHGRFRPTDRQPALELPTASTPNGSRRGDAADVLSEEARETAEYLRELVAYSPPNVLNMSWYDRAAAFADGRAAMAYSHSLLAPLFELNEKSPAYRRTGYCPIRPGRLVGRSPRLADMPWPFRRNIALERIPSVWTALQTFTSTHAVRLYTMNGSLACARKSVSSEPHVRALGLIHSWCRLRRKGEANFLKLLGI